MECQMDLKWIPKSYLQGAPCADSVQRILTESVQEICTESVQEASLLKFALYGFRTKPKPKMLGALGHLLNFGPSDCTESVHDNLDPNDFLNISPCSSHPNVPPKDPAHGAPNALAKTLPNASSNKPPKAGSRLTSRDPQNGLQNERQNSSPNKLQTDPQMNPQMDAQMCPQMDPQNQPPNHPPN